MIRKKTIFIWFIILSFSVPTGVFSQELDTTEIPGSFNSQIVRLKPRMHYSIGSSFTYIPRYGSVTGLTLSPIYIYPVSSKFSLEAGLIAGRYFPFMKNSSPETGINNPFNSVAVFGSARYQLNQRLSVYGTGTRQIIGTHPLFNLPTSSFSVGSTLDFGNFSIGAEIRMSDRNYYYSPDPFGGNSRYFPSFPW
jgi:hypothetical protein